MKKANVFSSAHCEPSSIKVLQLTDMHLMASVDDQLVGVNTEESFLSILSLAQQQSWPPDLIFLTGDLSQDGSIQSYQRLIEHLKKLGIPCYVLPGNHDTSSTLTSLFSTPPVMYQPFLHHKQWLFAFLNSETPGEEGGTLNEQEVANLQQEIDAHPDKHVLICLHHQLKPVGSQWLDSMCVANPAPLLYLIENNPSVQGIIHGHVHQSFSSTIAGSPVYSTPSTCFQFKPFSQEFAIDNIAPGYRWLSLTTSGGIHTDVIRLATTPNNLDQNSAGY